MKLKIFFMIIILVSTGCAQKEIKEAKKANAKQNLDKLKRHNGKKRLWNDTIEVVGTIPIEFKLEDLFERQFWELWQDIWFANEEIGLVAGIFGDSKEENASR